jgi:DNA polymerase-3 subunit epsilon
MSYLVFDTETTTFPNSKLSANHPQQARIIQLAWLLLDEQFQERACFCSLIDIPEHVHIHPGAEATHGISKSDCDKYGLPIEEVLRLFDSAYYDCGEARLGICHNTDFDVKLINIEQAITSGLSAQYAFGKLFCTMKALTPICKLPHKDGSAMKYGSPYKWPSLSEATKSIFKEDLVDAHDALVDVRATARLFKWLHQNGHVQASNSVATAKPSVSSSQLSTPIESSPKPTLNLPKGVTIDSDDRQDVVLGAEIRRLGLQGQ